jgi:hypothetical protein
MTYFKKVHYPAAPQIAWDSIDKIAQTPQLAIGLCIPIELLFSPIPSMNGSGEKSLRFSKKHTYPAPRLLRSLLLIEKPAEQTLEQLTPHTAIKNKHQKRTCKILDPGSPEYTR